MNGQFFLHPLKTMLSKLQRQQRKISNPNCLFGRIFLRGISGVSQLLSWYNRIPLYGKLWIINYGYGGLSPGKSGGCGHKGVGSHAGPAARTQAPGFASGYTPVLINDSHSGIYRANFYCTFLLDCQLESLLILCCTLSGETFNIKISILTCLMFGRFC